MLAYFDSGALLKIYIPERDSITAAALVQRQKLPIPLTPLHELEMRNAVRLKWGRAELTSDQAAKVLDRLDEDVAAGRLARSTPDWADVFARAEKLSDDHARSTLARSLDILHVACACALEARTFVSFDLRQRRVAAGAGLRVRPGD